MKVQNGAAVVENSMDIPWKILKIELPCDPATPLLHIYPKEFKSGSWRDSSFFVFIAA